MLHAQHMHAHQISLLQLVVLFISLVELTLTKSYLYIIIIYCLNNKHCMLHAQHMHAISLPISCMPLQKNHAPQICWKLDVSVCQVCEAWYTTFRSSWKDTFTCITPLLQCMFAVSLHATKLQLHYYFVTVFVRLNVRSNWSISPIIGNSHSCIFRWI